MKKLLTVLLSLFPVSLFALTAGETLPSLQLNDKVLTNVTVVTITPTYIIAKWDGGQGTIARKSIPSLPPEKIIPTTTSEAKTKVKTEAEYKKELTAKLNAELNEFIRNHPGKNKVTPNPNPGPVQITAIERIQPDLTAENLSETLFGILTYGQGNSPGVNPTILHTYKTGTPIPFFKIGKTNIKFTKLERQGEADRHLAFNSVANFDGIEIPFTDKIRARLAKADYGPIPGLLDSLSRQPEYKHVSVAPDTVTLFTPYELLSCTYGKDLNTVIQIKWALGNHTPALFWQQAIPIITVTAISGPSQVECIERFSGLYSDFGFDTGFSAQRRKLVEEFPGEANRVGPAILVYFQPNNYTFSGAEETEKIIQHEISHHIDPAKCYADLTKTGSYSMNYLSMGEYYVLASLLNRANYLLFGEPITNKEQAINIMALAVEYAKQAKAPIRIPSNKIPTNIKRPNQFFSTLPIGIRDAITTEFSHPHLPASSIQDPEIANSWLAFHCLLAL